MQHSGNDRSIEDGVPYIELGRVRDKLGNHIEVRWDDETHIVQVRLVMFFSNDDLTREWTSVGIARSRGTAFVTAVNWARGK
jgi:hypothetical protein